MPPVKTVTYAQFAALQNEYEAAQNTYEALQKDSVIDKLIANLKTKKPTLKHSEVMKGVTSHPLPSGLFDEVARLVKQFNGKFGSNCGEGNFSAGEEDSVHTLYWDIVKVVGSATRRSEPIAIGYELNIFQQGQSCRRMDFSLLKTGRSQCTEESMISGIEVKPHRQATSSSPSATKSRSAMGGDAQALKRCCQRLLSVWDRMNPAFAIVAFGTNRRFGTVKVRIAKVDRKWKVEYGVIKGLQLPGHGSRSEAKEMNKCLGLMYDMLMAKPEQLSTQLHTPSVVRLEGTTSARQKVEWVLPQSSIIGSGGYCSVYAMDESTYVKHAHDKSKESLNGLKAEAVALQLLHQPSPASSARYMFPRLVDRLMDGKHNIIAIKGASIAIAIPDYVHHLAFKHKGLTPGFLKVRCWTIILLCESCERVR